MKNEPILAVQSAEGKRLMDKAPIWDGSLPLLVSICFVLFSLLFRHLRQRLANRSLQPVDLNEFHALMDRSDEEFLRKKLPRAEFFRFKRSRIRVIWKYVRRIARNAAVVRRSAVSAVSDPDVKVAQAARKTLDLASQVQVQCRIASAKLIAEYMFPSIHLRVNRS